MIDPATELEMIGEIKQLERELYRKRTELAAHKRIQDLPYRDWGQKEWQQEFDDLVTEIGKYSSGGNSVEDVREGRGHYT